MNNYWYRRQAFVKKVKELEAFGKKNNIDIIYKINNNTPSYLRFEAEIFPLEPETYLDGKRYPYYPDDPDGIKAYGKLSRYWHVLRQHHTNNATCRSWFTDGILNT